MFTLSFNLRKKPNPNRALSLLIATAFMCGASSTHALSTDREQELLVDAHQSHTDQQANITILTGDVRITQGTIKGRGDKATVYGDGKGGIKQVVLVGNPAHVEQMLDNDGGLMTTDALTVDYKSDSDLVEMTGNVVAIQQNRGEFRGEHMLYNTKTGEMTGGDNNAESRVHLRMLPKVKTPDSKPAATPDKPAKSKNKNSDKTTEH